MSIDPNHTPHRTSSLIWWITSLLFHALVLGWLLFFSPVRVIDLSAKPEPRPQNISSARAAEVMEQIREQQADTLAGEVRALEEARHELATLEIRKRDELRQVSTNPPPALDQIVAAQEKAAQSQASTETLLKKLNEPLQPATGLLTAVTNASVGIRKAQDGAGQFQAEALEALALADPKFEPAYQAQADANAAQSRAAQAQAEAEGQLTGAAALRAKSAPAVDDLTEAKEMLHEAEMQLAVAISNTVVFSNSLPQLQTSAESAKTAYAAAQASGDKQQISVAKQTARDIQKAAENAQKNLTRALSDIPKFRSRITEQTARVAKFSNKANPLETNPESMQRSAMEKLRAAQGLQAAATSAQAQAAKVFAEARNGISSPSVIPVKSDENLAGIYQSAVQTEAALTEAYRRLRATDLALQRDIPLARALELTDAARPERPDLTTALSASQNIDPAAQRQAIQEARAQIAAMRSLADSMLAQARGLAASRSQQQTLENLAAEDDNQRVKDLTGAMQRGTSSSAGKLGTGGGKTSSGGSGSGTRSGSGGSGAGTAGSGGTSSGLNSGGVGDGTSSGPPPVPKDLAAIPGRVIGAGAVPGRWMFVDSWYLLGPFDNAGRANIEKQFPPETVVDLNATYAGKRGQPVRWDFFQSPQPRVVPPFDSFNPLANGSSDGGAGAFKTRDLEYIIYYGYTELRAEQECDVWIAIGSDDFSKLWIEDQPVWASGKQQKSWRVDEGLRKVHLKKGVNRVLIRVENGHSQSEFSVAICAATK